MGCHALLQGIFPTQGLKLGLLHWRQTLYCLSYQGSPANVPQSESEVAQLCPTLCDPMDCSLPGSSVHGIFQARVLEWVAISFSRVIFPTQGSNPGLLHRRQMLYRLSHQGRPQTSLQNSSLPGCGIHDAPHLNFPLKPPGVPNTMGQGSDSVAVLLRGSRDSYPSGF